MAVVPDDLRPPRRDRARRLLADAVGASNPVAVFALVAVNLIPLVGVAAWGWRVLDLMLLYWFETGVVGAFAVLKAWTTAPPRTSGSAAAGARALAIDRGWRTAGFLLPFGALWVGYGGVVAVAFAGPELLLALRAPFDGPGGSLPFGGPLHFARVTQSAAWSAITGALAPSALALVASHGVAFVTDHLVAGERRTATPGALLRRPYGRVALLHAILWVTGGAVSAAGEPWFALWAMVALKTVVDLLAHGRSRARGRAAP